MKIGMISTLNTNIGDDFIRDGIQYLINKRFDKDKEFVIINKHRPLSAVLPSVDALLGVSGRARNEILIRAGKNIGLNLKSKLDDCDIIIQCGTPIVWHGCSKSEWAGLIWEGILEKVNKKIPVLNIAGGSCFAWTERNNVVMSDEDRCFVRLMSRISRVTTVRDSLAENIFNNISGSAVKTIPCTAFLAASLYKKDIRQESIEKVHVDVLFNYMPGGGHFDLEGLKLASLW